MTTDRFSMDVSGSTVSYHVELENTGKELRDTLHAENLLESVSLSHDPRVRHYQPSDTSVYVSDRTREEQWRKERTLEARFIARHKMDVLFSQLAIFAKLPDGNKHLMAITCLDARGLVWCDVRHFRIVQCRKLSGKTVSESDMRKLLSIADARIHVYAQSFTSVLESYQHTLAGRACGTGCNIKSVTPKDRKPQNYILRGRPTQDVEFATRQQTQDDYQRYLTGFSPLPRKH